jgi:hypothetical protein
MRDNWASAIGVEIENRRMLGKRTLFVYDYPFPAEMLVEHIYFTSQFLLAHGFKAVYEYLRKQYEITLELNLEMLSSLPKDLYGCHFVVCIEARGLERYMKKSDTFRLLLDDYHTASVTLADMLITYPADYRGDILGTLKR